MQTIRVVLTATLLGFGKTLCELLRTARREP